MLDLDAARRLLDEFDQAACVIVKHNNPCGVAIADRVGEAYEKALACDPLSAYGGVIALNRRVDRALAERLHEHFLEVLIAPGYETDALEVLTQKEARADPRGGRAARAMSRASETSSGCAAGCSVQDPDRIDEDARIDAGRHRGEARARTSGRTCGSHGRSAATCARTRS